jgi:acetolactate synthase I/II/III large subunit
MSTAIHAASTPSVDGLPMAATTLVASLAAHGTDRVFCVAGESYLPVLDALYDHAGIDLVTCRHEGSAAFAALADGKLTRRPGICLVSRGPGATNAAIGVHAAAEDASPLILLVGGVSSTKAGREAFQDIDCAQLFGGIAKAVLNLAEPSMTGELLARAFRIAVDGTPGAVVLTLPEDILRHADTVGVPTELTTLATTPLASQDLDRVRDLLAAARRPLFLAGAQVDSPKGRKLIMAAAERHTIPVITSNKHQHLLPNRHPAYAGHLHNTTQLTQLSALDDADLVIAVGTRLDWVTTQGHRFPSGRMPRQALVHVYPDAERIGRHHLSTVGMVANPVDFLCRLVTWAPADPATSRAAWLARLHSIEAAKAVWRPVPDEDGIVFGEVAAALDELTGGEVTVVVDSGTFTSWIYRYLRLGQRGRLLGISSSAMGFAVGAGVSAALRGSEVPIIVIIGDGGFLMNCGELATAAQRQLPVVFVVANNSSYATIRLHQEMKYPGRTIGTDLTNPDFAAMAESFGLLGLTARTRDQVRPCLAKALGHRRPSVVEINTSLRHITAYQRLPPASQ